MALAALSTTGNLLLQPFKTLLMQLLDIIPGLVLAILVLILGYIVAYFIGYALKYVVEKAVGAQLREAHLSRAVGHTNWSTLIGELVKWFVFIVFLNVAVNILNLGELSDLMHSFVMWLPNVLFAIIIFFLRSG